MLVQELFDSKIFVNLDVFIVYFKIYVDNIFNLDFLSITEFFEDIK